MRLPPNRNVCAPRDQDKVSAIWICRPEMSDERDSPIVNGTDPARVYVAASSCGSHSVTGLPCRYEARASLRRFALTTAV